MHLFRILSYDQSGVSTDVKEDDFMSLHEHHTCYLTPSDLF